MKANLLTASNRTGEERAIISISIDDLKNLQECCRDSATCSAIQGFHTLEGIALRLHKRLTEIIKEAEEELKRESE